MIVLFAIFCLAASPAYPQSMLTLDDLQSLALSNNAKMKTAENNLQMAHEERKKAVANYFPVVSATGTAFQADKGMAALSLAQGMEVSMLKNGIAGAVTAVQPLFAGGVIANGNRLAKIGVEISREEREQAEDEVLLSVERQFWQIVSLQEKLNTALATDTLLESLCDDVEAAVSAGVRNRNDLLQIQLKRNSIKTDCMNARNGISIGKMALAQCAGLENANFELSYTMRFDTILVASPDSLYVPPQSALAQTTEYRLLEKGVEAEKVKTRLALGKNLPKIGVGAGYVYHDFLDTGRSFGIVFASVSIPISGWWGGSHEIKKQKLGLKNAENQMTDMEQKLLIKMQQSWNDLQNAYEQMGIAVMSIGQAKENLRLQADYYRAGTCTMSDLLEAQSLYQQSRDKYVESYAGYEIKKREYLQATGR